MPRHASAGPIAALEDVLVESSARSPSSSGRFSLVEFATASDERFDFPLSPPTASIAGTGIEARKRRIYCESADLELRLLRDEVLEATKADQIAKQTPHVVMR